MVPAGTTEDATGSVPGCSTGGPAAASRFSFAAFSANSALAINPSLSMRRIAHRIPIPIPPPSSSQVATATITKREISSHSLRRKNHHANAILPRRSHSILGRPAEANPPDFGRSKLS